MSYDLKLYEEFMLLALKEESGTVAASESIEYPLAAAIMTELMLNKRVELLPAEDEKQKIRLLDPSTLHDEILDEALLKIAKSKREQTLGEWIEVLAALSKLVQRVARKLCQRGILRVEEDRILMLFKRKVYPELDPAPEREIVERLRSAIFLDSADVDPRDAVLVALANQTHLLHQKFDKNDLKAREDRIKQIAEGSFTASGTKEIADAMNSAVLIAVFVPILFD
jgi:golgi phosphoprotein 3